MKIGQFDNFIIELGPLWCDWWETITVLDNGLSRSGDKPLSKPMVTQFSDAYVRHKGEMG